MPEEKLAYLRRLQVNPANRKSKRKRPMYLPIWENRLTWRYQDPYPTYDFRPRTHDHLDYSMHARFAAAARNVQSRFSIKGSLI